MMKRTTTRVMILMFGLMVFFSGAAYADPVGQNLRILIQAIESGQTTTYIISDGGADDQDVNPGSITFNTGSAGIGAFYLTLTLATAQQGTAGQTLTLDSRITLTGTGFGGNQPILRFALFGTDFDATLGNPFFNGSLTGDTAGTGASGTFQTYLGLTSGGTVPDFGPDLSGDGFTSPISVALPSNVAAFGSNPAWTLAGTSTQQSISGQLLDPTFSLLSTADITIPTAGTEVHFVLEGGLGNVPKTNDKVPEPTSLLLLGSGLAGLGFFRWKKGSKR